MDANAIPLDELVKLLSSDDWGMRFAAIKEMGRRRYEEGVGELGRCFEDADRDIRQAVLDALRSIGSERALALADDFQRIEGKLALDETVQSLLDRKKKPAARLEALKQLAQQSYDHLVEVCIQCAQDPDVKVERAAVRHVAERGGPETVGLLREKLSSPDAMLAAYAFEGLCRHPGALIITDALKFMSHAERSTRMAATAKVCEVGDETAAHVLEGRIRKTLPDLRWDSVATFDAKFDDLARRLNRQLPLRTDWVEDELVALLRTYGSLSRTDSADALLARLRVELGPLSEEEKWKARIESAAPRVADVVSRLCGDPAAGSSEDLFLLGNYYFDAYILPFLLACSRDQREVQYVPGKRLPGTLQAGYQMSFERAWLGVGHVFAFRFRNSRPESERIIEGLCSMLGAHPESAIRWRAANVLRSLKDERGLPALQRALADPEQDVRDEAREACDELLQCGTAFGRSYTLGEPTRAMSE